LHWGDVGPRCHRPPPGCRRNFRHRDKSWPKLLPLLL
jgi:hypothetical protein